jgi:uroporphyrin-III C-methyltransferase
MKRTFIFIIILMVVVVALVGAGGWQLYQFMGAAAELKTQMVITQERSAILERAVEDLRQANEKALALSTQQEQIINDWKAAQKGDLNKWYVAEAQYLVKLANDHVQFTHNTSMALTLLQRADQVLQKLSDNSVLDIRKSIAEKINALQSQAKVDVTGLYLELSVLNTQLDQLPLPKTPLKANQQAVSAPLADATWWQKGLDQTWQALQKIVIVRNNMQDVRPLILPEEKAFLYQNLHAQMEDAMWGALHRNKAVYQTSLARAADWIKMYFDPDASATQQVLQNISKLIDLNIEPAVLSLGTTLQLFDQYFTQAGSA